MLKTSHVGFVVGLIGVSLAIWRWREFLAASGATGPARGEVIFSNSPKPSDP